MVLAKRHVTEIHLMPPTRRARFSTRRRLVAGDRAVVKPLKLNYECLGNSEPHVHWHVSRASRRTTMRAAPIWMRPEAERKVTLDESDRSALIGSIRNELATRFPDARIPGHLADISHAALARALLTIVVSGCKPGSRPTRPVQARNST